MSNFINKSFKVGYLNLRAQTGFGITKQAQVEHFVKHHMFDILHLQEAQILEDSFETCDFITSNYTILTNNARNPYGTASLVAISLEPVNIKCDTQGRVIVFDIGDVTFGNVYLPSGNDTVMRNLREDYLSLSIPQLLINRKDNGCIGGDWNCITDDFDATKNHAQKRSPSLKRVIKTFSWSDNFRQLHKSKTIYSRYYSNNLHGNGATRIDRQYSWGNGIKIVSAIYTSVAFSDHMAQIYTMTTPASIQKSQSPKHKPLFKSKPEVIQDPIFKERLAAKLVEWEQVREAGANIIPWWELLVKPGIKKLLIERGKEMSHLKNGHLNLLLLRQSYLSRKLQQGNHGYLAQLLLVQSEINKWYENECEKVKIQSRIEDVDSPESVRIYHHELHARKIKKSSILKLQVGSQVIEGHEKVSAFLEQSVEDLLTTPADLCPMAQDSLLSEVKSVFSTEDNEMLNKDPTNSEVKKCVASSNMNAAPGNDGLTSFLYQHCWDILGKSLTEVAIAIHNGASPSISQRTSLMVYGCKANKPANSTDPNHKRRISLLNADFKIISGIYNSRLKGLADHTLSKAQLSVGSDRRIHHGINKARDAIFAASERNQKCGILDNDYKSAFDFMVLKWVFKVLLAKGMDSQAVNRLYNLYNNHVTVVVVNGVQGRSFPNVRWSIRQGDRPSSLLFCFGLDPLLDWLENRLKGIPIYTMDIFNAPSTTETYKVMAYVDDVKPGITSL